MEQPRQPSGTPVGGQFSGKSNPEADIVLDCNDFPTDQPAPNQPKRSDAHRPSELDPEDYEWVGAYDNSPEPGSFIGPGNDFEVAPGVMVHGTNYANAEYRYLHGLIESSPSARYGDGFQCDHCGARIRYVAVYRQKSTGDHIAVGETCADGRLSLDKATFQRLRKAAELDRKKQARKKAARECLAGIDDPTVRTLLDRDVDRTAMDQETRSVYEHDIVSDIRSRLWQYGSCSEKQAALVRRIFDEATEPLVPPPPSVPVPVGTHPVEGTIRTMRWVDNQWGGSVKMLVEVETPAGNYKVWGTLPAALRDLYRIEHGPLLANGSHNVRHLPVGIGAQVRFNATCEQSATDTAFGFFSRPTKAEVVAAPPGPVHDSKSPLST